MVNYTQRLFAATALLFLLSSILCISDSEASTALTNEQRSCLVDCRNCERRWVEYITITQFLSKDPLPADVTFTGFDLM